MAFGARLTDILFGGPDNKLNFQMGQTIAGGGGGGYRWPSTSGYSPGMSDLSQMIDAYSNKNSANEQDKNQQTMEEVANDAAEKAVNDAQNWFQPQDLGQTMNQFENMDIYGDDALDGLLGLFGNV